MGADPYSEELITRYLLGDLPEEQQIQIEDRAFKDKDYRQNIVAVENDLIDEYVRHELSEIEHRQFEKRFLTSAERRARVKFARALSTAVSEVSEAESQRETRAIVSAPLTWQASLAGLVRSLAPAAKFALATAALLIVVGGAWLVTQTMRQRAQLARLQSNQQLQQSNREALEKHIETERKRNEDLANQLAQEKQQRQQSEELMNQLQRETEIRARPPSQPTIVSLVLLPGISRSGSVRPKLALPESARLAQLQIGIEPEEEYKTFRVEIRTQDGRQIWTRDNLPARKTRSGKTVGLTLPARVLTAGQYELALKGVTDEGTTEEVGYYYFDVLKK